jgi:hypothetical protein
MDKNEVSNEYLNLQTYLPWLEQDEYMTCKLMTLTCSDCTYIGWMHERS